jgi:hypothetical protein
LDQRGEIRQLIAQRRSRTDNVIRIRTTTGGGAGTVIPFSVPDLEAVSPDGSRVAIIDVGDDSDDMSFRVTMHRSNGDTLYVRRYPFSPHAIPRRIADSVMTSHAQQLWKFNPNLAAEFEKRARAPRYYPPIVGLVIAMDGSLWVKLRHDARGTPYLILTPRGDVVGVARLPHNTRIAAANEKHAWAIERDSLDVESLRLYRILGRE